MIFPATPYNSEKKKNNNKRYDIHRINTFIKNRNRKTFIYISGTKL